MKYFFSLCVWSIQEAVELYTLSNSDNFINLPVPSSIVDHAVYGEQQLGPDLREPVQYALNTNNT